jgi:hypothetical protein
VLRMMNLRPIVVQVHFSDGGISDADPSGFFLKDDEDAELGAVVKSVVGDRRCAFMIPTDGVDAV